MAARIKILRTDNGCERGCEYTSNVFQDFLKNEGIIHQKTNTYTPEQNGLSERSNRTIVERDFSKQNWIKSFGQKLQTLRYTLRTDP